MHVSSITKVTLNVFPGKGEKGFNFFNGVKISVARNSRPFEWNTEGTFRNYWDLFACAEESCLMCFHLKQLALNFYFMLFLQSFLPFLLDSTQDVCAPFLAGNDIPEMPLFSMCELFSPDESLALQDQARGLCWLGLEGFWLWLPLVQCCLYLA